LPFHKCHFRAFQILLDFAQPGRRFRSHEAFAHLVDHRQFHRDVEPIQDVLRLWAHVHLQLAQGVLSIAEEGHGLAQFQTLRSQGLVQPTLGLLIIVEHEAKVLAFAGSGDAFADDHLEPSLLALYVPGGMHVGAIESYSQGRLWLRHRVHGHRLRVALQKVLTLVSQLGFHPHGHLVQIGTQAGHVEVLAHRQNFLQQIKRHSKRQERAPLGFQIQQLWRGALRQHFRQQAECLAGRWLAIAVVQP
jgi:hypothetical protein